MSHKPHLPHQDFSRPKTPLEYLRLYFTGFAMGAADIVPGVSGGTMAFILGVYETLLNAIKSINVTAVRLALKREFAALFDHVPVRFLIPMGLGLLTAIFTLSNVLHNLLEKQPTYIFAFFGGLIIASVLAIAVKVEWSIGPVISLIVAAAAGFIIVSLPAVDNAGHSPIVLFLSGMIAICAMILPGISGSFILLILGQYEFVLEAVKSFKILTIIPFTLGTIVGILSFARVLSWFLKHYEHITIAALVGFMAGSLRKIWDESVKGVDVIKETGDFGAPQVALVIALIIVGFLIVSLLDHLQTRENPVFVKFWKPGTKADVVTEQAQALD